MPGGFWIFLLIVVANLVVTIIKKAAEKRAAASEPDGGGDAGASAVAARPQTRRYLGEGDHELVLQRSGDNRLQVIEILRKELRWDLPTAMTLAGTTPSVVATGLTRAEAGSLRNQFESAGAGVSIRRKAGEGVSTSRDLDLGRAARDANLLPATAPVEMPQRGGIELERADRRVEALRRRESVASPPTTPPAPKRTPRPPRTRRETPATASSRGSAPTVLPTVAPELASKAELPDLPAPRAARAARRSERSDTDAAVPAGATLGRRIRAVTRERQALREAFLLQELLRPPLSLRATGCGGRDS